MNGYCTFYDAFIGTYTFCPLDSCYTPRGGRLSQLATANWHSETKNLSLRRPCVPHATSTRSLPSGCSWWSDNFTQTLRILPISTSLSFFHSTRTFPTLLLKSSAAAISAGGLNILLPHVDKLETKTRRPRSSNGRKRVNKNKTHTRTHT